MNRDWDRWGRVLSRKRGTMPYHLKHVDDEEDEELEEPEEDEEEEEENDEENEEEPSRWIL